MALTRINKKIDNAIPVNTEDMFLYKRKETNGGEVVVSKRHPELQQLVLNSTMVDILEKCDGKTAVQDLFSTLYDEYKSLKLMSFHHFIPCGDWVLLNGLTITHLWICTFHQRRIMIFLF